MGLQKKTVIYFDKPSKFTRFGRLLIHYAFLTYRLSSHNGKPPVWHAAKFYFSRERLDYLVVGSVADTTWCDIHKITPGDFMKKCVYEECVYEKVFVKKCVLCH